MAKEIIECSICKKLIERKSKNHKKCLTCSNQNNYTPRTIQYEKMPCKLCQEMFRPKSANQDTCTKVCRRKHEILRMNEEWKTREPSNKCKSRVSQVRINSYIQL